MIQTSDERKVELLENDVYDHRLRVRFADGSLRDCNVVEFHSTAVLVMDRTSNFEDVEPTWHPSVQVLSVKRIARVFDGHDRGWRWPTEEEA